MTPSADPILVPPAVDLRPTHAMLPRASLSKAGGIFFPRLLRFPKTDKYLFRRFYQTIHKHTSTSAHQHTSTPAHQHTSTPAQQHTRAPHHHTTTPAHQHTSTRARKHTSTPAHRHTGTPAPQHTGHPGPTSQSNTSTQRMGVAASIMSLSQIRSCPGRMLATILQQFRGRVCALLHGTKRPCRRHVSLCATGPLLSSGHFPFLFFSPLLPSHTCFLAVTFYFGWHANAKVNFLLL